MWEDRPVGKEKREEASVLWQIGGLLIQLMLRIKKKFSPIATLALVLLTGVLSLLRCTFYDVISQFLIFGLVKYLLHI